MTSKQCTRPEKCPSSCSSINSSQSSLPENSLFSGPIRCNYAKLSAGWFGDTLVLLLPCYKPLVLEKWKWKLKDVPLDSIDPLQLVRPFYSHEAESISVWGWVEVSFFSSSPVTKVSPLLLSSQNWCPFRTYERFLCHFLLASFLLLYLAFVCLVCPPLATYDRLIRPLFRNFVLINAERRRLEYAPGLLPLGSVVPWS